MAFPLRSRLTSLTRNWIAGKKYSHLNEQYAYIKQMSLHTTSFLDVKGQEIKMPSLSPTMSEGTIVKWLKSEGETISPGDVLCEIQTDKAVMSFETEEEGILAKILIPESTKDIKVGSLIALMVSEGEDWKNVELPSTTPSPSSSSAAEEFSGNVPGSQITMPSLSPTMTVGTITKWHKKEGDKISPGDVLCDIQTDKAVMSFETEEEGILAKILIPEGTADINVGALIGIMVEDGADWTQVQLPSSSSASSLNTSTKPVGTVPGTSISMPSLSPTMTEGTIVKWYKKEGDTIAAGDVLCDIQTDKAVMSFEIEDEGILAKIMITEGTSGVKVGSLVALMVGENENWQDVIVPGDENMTTNNETSPTKPVTQTDSSKISYSHKVGNYGPAVRSLLELYRIDSCQIKGSGKNSKILKSDILNYITDRKLQPLPPVSVPLPQQKSPRAESVSVTADVGRPKRERYVDIELSSMRKTIAKRLTESKTTIPHSYATVESKLDSVLTLRKQMKTAGINVSVNDFIIKAVALALKECTLVNCIYTNDQATPAPSIDISVAVATDAGLITPIIKNANAKAVNEISVEIKDLAARAKVGKLQLHEFQGGSFTISNLGMFGISEFSAIINPPQCAILAVGGGRSEIDITGKAITKMTSTLSYDARAISEVAVADFLEVFQMLLEHPASILMGSSMPRRAVSTARN